MASKEARKEAIRKASANSAGGSIWIRRAADAKIVSKERKNSVSEYEARIARLASQLDVAESEKDEWWAIAERYEKALREIAALLGPELCPGIECEGCKAEVGESLRLALAAHTNTGMRRAARAALKGEDDA